MPNHSFRKMINTYLQNAGVFIYSNCPYHIIRFYLPFKDEVNMALFVEDYIQANKGMYDIVTN